MGFFQATIASLLILVVVIFTVCVIYQWWIVSQQVEQLGYENAELRRDKERLDRLEKTLTEIGVDFCLLGNGSISSVYSYQQTGGGSVTLREAIDRMGEGK